MTPAVPEGSAMKSHTEYLTFTLTERMAFQNITPRIEAAVAASGVREGLCLVSAMHITASVFINDDEPGLHADYERLLAEEEEIGRRIQDSTETPHFKKD